MSEQPFLAFSGIHFEHDKEKAIMRLTDKDTGATLTIRALTEGEMLVSILQGGILAQDACPKCSSTGWVIRGHGDYHKCECGLIPTCDPGAVVYERATMGRKPKE